MRKSPSPDRPATPSRGPRITAAQVLCAPAVQTLRKTLFAARESSGTSAVTQAEVDQAAQALLLAKLPPYPTLVRIVTGGSNSTVGPLLADWWHRFGAKLLAAGIITETAPITTPDSLLNQQVSLLVSQLEATLRERLQGQTDPAQALLAAARLGEQQGLKSQLEAIAADRDHVKQQLTAMTYQVAALETQLKAQAAAKLTEQNALEAGLERLSTSLEHLNTRLTPQSDRSTAELERLTSKVRRLIPELARSRSRQRPRKLAASRRGLARTRPARKTTGPTRSKLRVKTRRVAQNRSAPPPRSSRARRQQKSR